MIEKLKEAAASARLKAGVWMRERKEKQEAQKALNSEHGHGRFFLLHVPAIATICAAIVEWYWAILFCIEATGHVTWDYETSFGTATAAASNWSFAFSTHWPVFAGLVLATLPIVMLSMVWLPVQFAMRGTGRWRRGTVIFVGVLANILVIVSGTVVMNHNRQDQVRDALVVEQQAGQSRAGMEAQRAQIQGRLDALLNPDSNSFQSQAARAGVVGWDVYIETARRQYQEGTSSAGRLALIESARGSAVAAETYQAQIDALTVRIAEAPTAAAVAMNVEDNVGAELNTFAQYVEVWRPPFIAVLATLIGIFGSWWVLALMQGLNPRDVMRSGWADEAHRIEDLRDEPSVTPQPMRPAREVVTDAETGEELVKVKPREYWRKAKGKRQRVETKPDIPPDETGVTHDGGGRVGSSNEPAVAGPQAQNDGVNDDSERQNDDAAEAKGGNPDGSSYEPKDDFDARSDQNESPDYSDEELAAIERELATADQATDEPVEPTAVVDSDPEQVREGGDDGEVQNDAAPSDEEAQDTPPREPETNPARMIAAE
jgi:hypothetical protein